MPETRGCVAVEAGDHCTAYHVLIVVLIVYLIVYLIVGVIVGVIVVGLVDVVGFVCVIPVY